MRLSREEIILNVMAKLASKQSSDQALEAGVKDWIAGALMTFTSIFGGIDNAMGSAKDLNQFLNQTEKKVETSNKLKNQVKVNKTFKSLGGENGSGSFSVKVGPFTVHGEYVGVEGTVKNLKVKVDAPKNAPEDQIEAWKSTALNFSKDIEKAFNKQKVRDKKEIEKSVENGEDISPEEEFKQHSDNIDKMKKEMGF